MTTSMHELDEQRPAETGVEGRRKRYRWVWVVAAVILAAAAGVGAGWLAHDDGGSSTDGDVPADVESLVGEWTRAWDNGNGEAAVSLMEPGALHFCPTWPSGVSGDELVRFVDRGASISDSVILSVTSPQLSDELNSTADSYVVVTQYTLGANPGWMSVLLIGEDDGELQIQEHRLYPNW